MVKKKISIFLILFLLVAFLTPAATTATGGGGVLNNILKLFSAGTAEAYTVIATERKGDTVYQRSMNSLGSIEPNVEKTFGFAVTDTDYPTMFWLTIAVTASNGGNYSDVFINKEQVTNTSERNFGSFQTYRGSFPATYDSSNGKYFFPYFPIRINGSDKAEYKFTVRAYHGGSLLAARTFTLTVHKSVESEYPSITYPPENTTIPATAPGKTGGALRGTNVAKWRIETDKINANAQSLIKNISIADDTASSTSFSFNTEYSSQITDGSSIGSLTFYAANQYGYEVSRDVPLTYKLKQDYAKPVLEYTNLDLKVRGGVTAVAKFYGRNAVTWDCDTSNLPGFIQDVTLVYDYTVCNVHVTLSPDAMNEKTVLTITAHNGTDTQTATATLHVTAMPSTEARKAPIIDADETINVIQGGKSSALFTGQYVKRWGYKGELPTGISSINFDYDSNPNKCNVTVTAASDATPSSGVLSLDVYAYNAVGDEITTPKKLYINILQDASTAVPEIDDAATAKEIKIVPGGTATVTFTGKNTRTWDWGVSDEDGSNILSLVDKIELDYASNPARCDVRIKMSGNAAANDSSTINIYAYNESGRVVTTPATLNISVTATDANTAPSIDAKKSVNVVKGGTASTTFTGQHIKSWSFGMLPEAIHAIELRYNTNPNVCEVLVTANDDTSATSATVNIYAYNAIGMETSETLTVNIVESDSTKYPAAVINTLSGVKVAKGGTVNASLTGSNIKSWGHGNLPDGITALEFKYTSNPNNCTASITASSTATIGEKTITIYAYNEIGEAVSKTLTVNVVAADTDSSNDPVIDDKSQTARIIPGGTASVKFTGKNTSAWAYGTGTLPDNISHVEMYIGSYTDRCAFIVTASSTAKVGDTGSFEVYAYNELGEVSDTATINVTIVADDGNNKPTIENADTTTTRKVKPGGVISANFTSENAVSWNFKPSKLPDVVYAIDVSYDIEHPETCTVTVLVNTTSTSALDDADAASEFNIAADTEYSVPIYAYSEIGSEASVDLKFTVSDSDDDTGSSKGSSSGCDTGVSSLTDLGVAGLLILIYYLVSRRRAK